MKSAYETVEPLFAIGWGHACNKKRISNMEYRRLKLYGRGKNFIIRHSVFDIRYFIMEHGMFIILELPTSKELAKRLPAFALRWNIDLPYSNRMYL
jgi:hypothetical protein